LFEQFTNFFTFQTPLLTPDLVDTSMDPPLRTCHDCKQLKPLSEFKLREKDDRYGKKGGPTSRCTQCTLRSQLSRQNLKRKRANDDAEELISLCISDSVLSVDQFTAQLANRAPDGSLRCCTRIATQGMVGNTKEVANIIAGHVWEATGYRFTLVDSEYNVTGINR
jgi:hypothetical protein